MTWYVRRASLRDRDTLESLCVAAVGENDYVIPELESLLLRSVVHVALEGDRIVGMMAYRPCLDGSAWLGQARTHPDFRRQGVARAIIDNFSGLARNSNVSTLRLWSESTNEEGLASFATAGFREVGRFVRVMRDLPRTPRKPSGRGTPRSKPRAFDEDLWRQVAASAIVRKGQGYAYHEGYFVASARPVVFGLAARGVFRGWDGNLLALTDPQIPSDEVWFTMWAGRPAEIFPETMRLAAANRWDSLQTFLPNDADLLAEARSAGYDLGTWGREAVLAELSIAPTDLRKRTRPTYAELAAARSGRGHTHADTLGWARWNP